MTQAQTMLELNDIADEIEQSDGIVLMLTGTTRQLGIRKSAMVVAALRATTAAAQPVADDEDKMEKISALIARLQETKDRWGDTCVYIRRGGLAWGAVALNRRGDDEKHGVFDLQAQHDRDMLERLEQIERLKASRDRAETKLREHLATPSPPRAR